MKRKLVAILTLCIVAILSMIGLTACDTSIKATGITLNKTSISLFVGDSATLTATITPDDTTDKTITWTTSDDEVATVADGDVLAVGEGSATITATTANGKTATCVVTVQTSAMWFNTMQEESGTYKKTVSSQTEIFKFSDEIGTRGRTTFAVSLNMDGSDPLSATTVTLVSGSNVFYIVEYLRGEKVEVHRTEIYRLRTFEVKYFANGGLVTEMAVEEGSFADDTIDAPERQGYEFTGWNFDFTTPITENVEIIAKYDPATDTKYVIKYYLENVDGAFTLNESLTDEKEGTTESEVTATPKDIDNYVFDEENENNVKSGIVTADGGLILKLYYARKSFEVTATAKNGKVANTGSYKFGDEVTLIATANVGYKFVGWLIDGDLVSEDLQLKLTIDGDVEIVASFEKSGTAVEDPNGNDIY